MAWQVELDGGWKGMAPEDIVQMEANFHTGKKQFTMKARGQAYEIDLRGDPPWTQTNITTGQKRQIRRQAVKEGLKSAAKAAPSAVAQAALGFFRPKSQAAASSTDTEPLVASQKQHEPAAPAVPPAPIRRHYNMDEADDEPQSWRQRARSTFGLNLENMDMTQVLILVGIGVAILVFWNTRVVYPLKMLVVFFHEACHGIAAVLTGGKISSMELDPREGGVCYTIGGNRFITLSAGYLGSMLFGGTILLLASRTHHARIVSMVLGVFNLLLGVFFVRPWFGFGQLFTLGSAAALIAVGFFAPERVNDIILRVVGLTSCWYAILDIKSDIIDRPHVRSDAAMLSELTGIPTMFWGLLWIVLAAVCSAYFVLLASKHEPGREEGNQAQQSSLA